MRHWVLYALIAVACAISSPAKADDYETTKSALQRELASFDKICSLAPLAEDASLFRYVKERASTDSWSRAWSPRKIMATLIDISALPTTTSGDKRLLWVVRDGLREEAQLVLKVEYNTDESKDQSFFKERRTCNDRLVAQASANFDYFVKSYSKTHLSISHQGALTITHGTWTSDVATRVAARDRDLFRQLYDLYQLRHGTPKFAVISRLRAVTVLGTADRAMSARLEAGLSASGGISFVSGDLQVESSTAVGQTIQLQTINTLISTVKGKWLDEDKDKLPQPDISLQDLPSKQDVETRLHEHVTVQRDAEWLSEAGSQPKLGIKVLGITKKECENLIIAEQVGGTPQPKTRLSWTWDDSNAACKTQVETAAIPSTGEYQKNFTVFYRSLELGSVSDKVFVNAVIKGVVKLQGRATDTQLPRWDVEFAGGSVPFTIGTWNGTLTFSCADNAAQKVQLTTQVNGNTVTFLSTQPLQAGCKATPPTLRVVPKNGVAIDAPVSGILSAP